MCMDGTFLIEKYKWQILMTIRVCANNWILPMDVAFVENENFDSRLWFFRHLKVSVVGECPDVCIIHDRYVGLIKVIKKL